MMITSAVKFWVYLILLVPSMICLLFTLFHLLTNHTLRSAVHNHAIIVLLLICLIMEVTIYPWMLYFYQLDDIWNRSPIFCSFWGFLDWGLYVTQTILFAWISIERHILIFHDKWISTKQKRFCVHYLPLILFVLYCLIFYIIVFFFPPCTNDYNYSIAFCADFCLLYIYIYSMWEMIAHQILPGLLIIVLNIALFLRVLWVKHRMHQPIQWRKHRKMIIQVLAIFALYLLFFFPWALYNLLWTFDQSIELVADFGAYTECFSYFMTLLLPFVCTFSIPELRTKLFNILHLKGRTRRVDPITIAVKPMTQNQTNIR